MYHTETLVGFIVGKSEDIFCPIRVVYCINSGNASPNISMCTYTCMALHDSITQKSQVFTVQIQIWTCVSLTVYKVMISNGDCWLQSNMVMYVKDCAFC